MKASFLFMVVGLFLSACNKMAEAIIDRGLSNNNSSEQFTQFTIKQGAHYCDNNQFKKVDINELKFTVRFDSSAIYKTIQSSNQNDINKLYGFADNNMDHHQFSARFGWRWSNNALRLFAYVYNKGVVHSKELGTVKIDEEVHCAIKVNNNQYQFILNENSIMLPRESRTATATGYQLYPYFGGDETAPHDIRILIRHIN